MGVECGHRIAHSESAGRAYEAVVNATYGQTFSLDNSSWFLFDTNVVEVDD